MSNNPKEPSVPNNPESRLTPDITALFDSFDDRIAALDRRLAAFDLRMTTHDMQVRSALLAADAGAQTMVQLSNVVHTQADYIERLDDLWHAHMLTACDRVMAAADDNEPAPDDVLQVDLWHLGDDIVKRSEA